jgi:hypothetical protein
MLDYTPGCKITKDQKIKEELIVLENTKNIL